MGREGERHSKLSSQFPGCSGRFGREVGMKEFRLELQQGGPKLLRVIDHAFFQAGLPNDLVAPPFVRWTQREDAYLHAAPAQLRELPCDERLRELREDIDHIGDAAQHHLTAPREAISERTNSTTRTALQSHVYRPGISFAAAWAGRCRSAVAASSRSQAATSPSMSPCR